MLRMASGTSMVANIDHHYFVRANGAYSIDNRSGCVHEMEPLWIESKLRYGQSQFCGLGSLGACRFQSSIPHSQVVAGRYTKAREVEEEIYFVQIW